MPDTGSAAAESPGAPKSSAAKDRNCPYCGQAFTSSSLGRHLDLYIKEKNPKAPDGIHDVDAIRKMRGSITRRQPRGSLARRDTSTPGTPTTSSRQSPGPDGVKHHPGIPKEGHFVVDHQTPKYPFQATWEATGVINDIPSRNEELKGGREEGLDSSRRPSMARAPSRVMQKTQLDARQKLADAMDTARAAELALRELLSSWRAAKQHIDMNSVPFDFDPLSLDFPALTLQCLQAPPTLFSSTPHPTSTSWSIQPPSQKQYEALKTYFREEFRKWRVTCAMATTSAPEDLSYPPSSTFSPQDMREAVKRAERAAASLETQVSEHLQSTYHVWEQLPVPRRTELWTLELARSNGRRQKDVERLKETQRNIKQENANLKSHIDQLNRLQQPREFRIVPPATIPIEETLMSYILDLGAKGHRGIGLETEDRHADLSTVVSRAIERWKTVIVSSRSTGMNAQRPLDQATPTPTSATPSYTPASQSQVGARQQPQQRSMPATTNVQTNNAQSTTPTTAVAATPATTSSAANDDNSDQDADAEMEEEFAPITPVIAKPPQQQQLQQLDVPRTRGHDQRIPNNNNTDARFAVNGTGPARGTNNVRQQQPQPNNMQNMNSNAAAAAMQGRMQHGQHGVSGGGGHTMMNNSDYGTVVQGVGGGDPMYMD
ncbi:hypothetical protein F5B20DRAFT_549718 [Whalleya microplaca]|nr:hypothetical protein F5B20DRAFT_549718 [Whalleya microplaca]